MPEARASHHVSGILSLNLSVSHHISEALVKDIVYSQNSPRRQGVSHDIPAWRLRQSDKGLHREAQLGTFAPLGS